MVLLVVVAPGLSTMARADDALAPPESRTLARDKVLEGSALLKAGEFQQALAAFKDAYKLYPSPKIHYDLAVAYQGLGRNAEALDALDAFLDKVPDVQPDFRERARAMRATLLDHVGTLLVKGAPGTGNVIVDGRDLGPAKRDERIALDPGPHLLMIERSGGASPFTSRFDLAAKAQVIVTVPAENAPPATASHTAAGAVVAPIAGALDPSRSTSTPAPVSSAPSGSPLPSATEPDRGRPWRIAGITAGSGGVALVGAGVFFGLAARSAAAAVSMKYDADRDSAGRRDATLAWVGYGAGAAALAAGAWLYLHGTQLQDVGPSRETASAGRFLVTARALAWQGTF